MPGMAVNLDRAPFSAFLLLWGRAPDTWWGCVQFMQTVEGVAGRWELPVAAWLPATSIRRPGWASPVELPRVLLTVDQAGWPPPPGWPAWYAGPWPNGTLRLPGDLSVVTGPRWQPGRRSGRRGG